MQVVVVVALAQFHQVMGWVLVAVVMAVYQ